MILVFIALVVALAVVLAIYRQPRGLDDSSGIRALPSPVQRGLFEQTADQTQQAEAIEADEFSKLRAELKRRASEGELAALRDAHASSGTNLYREVLEALVEQAATRQDLLRALVYEVTSDNSLRASASLARLVMEAWKTDPSQRSTAEMIHIAALSDDAKTYEASVGQAVESWRSGKLSKLSADDLIALVESQYWLLSSEARSSGAGFALKQRLAGVRRELTTAASTR
jgi:hypothetical protein